MSIRLYGKFPSNFSLFEKNNQNVRQMEGFSDMITVLYISLQNRNS